ncbi:hypothetical protein C7S13_1820 [Burkholderia cepacia]|nr:hypothetical protein [Burkholderia cepacia]
MWHAKKIPVVPIKKPRARRARMKKGPSGSGRALLRATARDRAALTSLSR